jgi:DNA-3-methyladenine glycosylase II
MFLMFAIMHPDILPVGDLGLRMGVRDAYGLKELPTPDEVTALAEKWKPYRSVATWYMWRSRDIVPQSGQGG